MMKKKKNQSDKALENIEYATKKPFEVAPEKKRTVLRSRAKKLAQELGKRGSDTDYLEVLEFLLAHETYAIETMFVREVYPMTELTPLPCTPVFVFGLINVRGQILTVIDMKKFFDLPEKGITNLNKVIVVRKDAMELGILVDEIIGIRNLPVSELQPPLSTMTGIHAEYLKGVTGERLIVLDMERFLTDRRLIVQEEIET
jgi:purine-binding chemotaxis protein CheW